MPQFWIRPFNADRALLETAITDGLRPAGLIVDANIGAHFTEVNRRLREEAAGIGAKFLIDPNTHKIRKPYFREKVTYRKLPYYYDHLPALAELHNDAEAFVRRVIDSEVNLGATHLLSPYLFLDEGHFPIVPTQASVPTVYVRWLEEFSRQVAQTGMDHYYSLCITMGAIVTPESIDGVRDIVRAFQMRRLYLLLVDCEVGRNQAEDDALKSFIRMLRNNGISEIVLSHGPLWVYLLFPFGLDGFASGINFLTSLDRSYFEREADIAGISHNYYLTRRFCRAKPEQTLDLVQQQIFDPCPCPICQQGVPTGTNEVRLHYLHARQQEIVELRDIDDQQRLLREWLKATGEFINDADSAGIQILSRPPVGRWSAFLE